MSLLAPTTASFTAKGLTEEYMIKGENASNKINMKPLGPKKYLFQGVPKGLIFIISA